MGTTAQKLQAILDSKSDIKDAIEAKGVTVGDAPFDEYASKINAIPTPIEEAPENDVNFYDYTGFRVASYTIAEAKALTALPTPPSHEGLTFQEWNWSLADIQGYNRQYIDIGANYITSDGKTHFKVRTPWDNFTISFRLYFFSSTTITIDWGDGTDNTYTGTTNITHTYSNKGNYDVKIYVDVAASDTNVYVSLDVTNDRSMASWRLSVDELNIGANFTFQIFSCELKISIPTTGITVSANSGNFYYLTTPIFVIPKGNHSFTNTNTFYLFNGKISFPKQVTSVKATRFLFQNSSSRIVFPEYTDGENMQAPSTCYWASVMSFPYSLKFSGNFNVNGASLLYLDIVQGWVPSDAMALSGSTKWTAETIVKFFNKLGTTQTAITLTFGSTNLNKLTAEEKAIATNKGYTLA